MAVGALNRKQVRANLSTLLGAASGVAESAWIDLESGPQGRAHLYWSIADLSSSDDGHRSSRGREIGKRWSATVRLAYRVNPKQRETSRDAALDNLDTLERAIRNSGNAARERLEIMTWSDTERQSGAREWLVWDISIGVSSLFDLAG